MADHGGKDELERFRRELLESSDLDNATVGALIEMGFQEVHTLRHLPKSHVMIMEGLTLAQKFILIGEIEEKFKNMSGRNTGSRSTCTSCSEHSEKQKKDDIVNSKIQSEPTNPSNQDRHKNQYSESKKPETEGSAGNEYEQVSTDVNAETSKGQPKNKSDTYQPRKSSKKKPGKSKSTGSFSERRADPNSSSQYHRTGRPTDSDSHQEAEIEEIQRPEMNHISRTNSDEENARCEVARKHFTEGKFSAMENVLTGIDEEIRSARGRIRFGAMLLNLDFSEVYDCVNLQTNDVTIMHELIRQQFSNLADSHQSILRQMGLPYKDNTYSEWAVHVSTVFREHSDLEYGSDQWKRCTCKTEQLSRFLSKLKEPAKNVSKSFILLILHVVNRALLIRQRASPSDYHALLQIATFCLPLCQLEFLKSINFCELMHDAYANAIVMLGFNITNGMLKVEMYYNQFTEIKTQLEEFYNQCLQFSINPRSEYVQDNLDKVTDDVELKWLAYLSKTNGRTTTDSSSKYQHTRTTEEYIERIIELCNRRLYSEITREIAEAENVLQETEFKLKIGCRISSRYKHAHDSLSLPIDTFGNERALFIHLRDQLIGLVTDCNEMLREMKIYSNDALAKWVELFLEFYSSDKFMYGSEMWQNMLTTGKTVVYDIPKGIDDNGRTIIQIYIQLIMMLIKKVMTTYKRLNHSDYLGHLRLSSMCLTMTKSSLLNSKWYTQLRHDAYQRNTINLGLCIINGIIIADDDVHQRFKDMKRALDKLKIDYQKLRISTRLPEDRDEINRISEEIEKKIAARKSQDVPTKGHCEVNVIGGNEAVCELVSSAINSYRLREFEEMTASLDEAEIFETCRIRHSFATFISPLFSQVFDFSNNIPETSGLEVVYNTTYANLDILANDHAKIATYMGEAESTVLCNLVDFLFTQEEIRPYTEEWDYLMEMARAVVTYFESLSKAGQCVTKCYVLLFLTVLHNFMATRNRLRLKEHYKILPFVFACIPFCESEMIESDAWVKTRYDVYEIAVLKTGSALGAGQISYAHWFADHLDILDDLERRAKILGFEACTQKEQLLQARTTGTDLWAGSLPRMCISAALYYYHSGCYKGMIAILVASDQTKDAKDIRMNFAMQLSDNFELCVEQHNAVGEAISLDHLLTNAKFVLELISADHSTILTQMGFKNTDCLLDWVKTLFGIIENEEPNTFNCIAWKEAEKQSLTAAEYIKKMSKPGRCISQAYLSFFMSFCMNFITRRHFFIEDDFMTELQIILPVIKLCKDTFETSNFSVRMKSSACRLAASLFTRITESSESLLIELKELVTMEKECKVLTKQFDEESLCKGDKPGDVSNKDSEEINKKSQENERANTHVLDDTLDNVSTKDSDGKHRNKLDHKENKDFTNPSQSLGNEKGSEQLLELVEGPILNMNDGNSQDVADLKMSDEVGDKKTIVNRYSRLMMLLKFEII